MLLLNNSPIARALSSARSSAGVSSLPHSHRKSVHPSPWQPCSLPRSTSFSPHKDSKTTRPDSEDCSDPTEPRTFAPLYSCVALTYPPRKRNVNPALLEVA